MNITQINPWQAEKLIQELDEYQAQLYPAESNHLDSIDTLCQPNVYMVGAKDTGNLEEILAIGAVKIFKGYGEIKRVYVPLDYRGRGLAKKIMVVLEKKLRDDSIFWAKLETGIHQQEAIGLYKALGYQECKPFGEYGPDPLSVFMEKRLDP